MLRNLFLVCVSAVFVRAASIGARAHGDILGQSDFQVNLRPPVENVQEIQEALDSLFKMESSKHAVDPCKLFQASLPPERVHAA